MSRTARISLAVLVLVHLAAAGANFLAPYDPSEQHREHPWASPARLHLSSSGLFSDGEQVRFLITKNGCLRLFGVRDPGRIFLLGTDGLGRDQYSRLLHGARISLFSGLCAALLAAFAGGLTGAIAGYFGSWPDRMIMRAAELFLSLPWMYLLLAVRAFFPLETDPRTLFLTIIALLGLLGWARPARLTRGIVMSAKQRDYVLASSGFGGSTAWVLRRHILPEALPTLLVYLGLAIPQYVLAEATLSFLGLGAGETMPSWGLLLAELGRLEAMTTYWWLSLPAVAFACVFLCYHRLVEGLQDRQTARSVS
jgi:peptide/nickel transport system permease protein